MYCPECRSEYRPGITECRTCQVALVEQLVDARPIEPEETTLMVGRSGDRTLSHVVEVAGRKIDLGRCFVFDEAKELQQSLEDQGIPTLLREVELQFPDQRPHFEVHVRAEDHARAEGVLHERWKKVAAAEAGAAVGAEDFERCPACGSAVPLEVEECPDCGLFVGVGAQEPGPPAG